MIQAAKAGSVDVFHSMFQTMYQDRNSLADWGETLIVPLYKKGYIMGCSMQLLGHKSLEYTRYTKILHQRIKKYVEES